MAYVFLAGTIILSSILWLALPTLEEDDRPKLRIPKSFAQLQDLNGILKKYRDIFPTASLYASSLQMFSLPGSMYMSVLGGAVWGMPLALPLVCCLVASGATLCYLISEALGPALLTLPKWKARLDKWARKIQDNMISFLIVLRIALLPPHWILNILMPHVGISIPIFWISTSLGILGVSVIHTTIGGGLEQMTSSDDFHLISWRSGRSSTQQLEKLKKKTRSGRRLRTSTTPTLQKSAVIPKIAGMRSATHPRRTPPRQRPSLQHGLRLADSLPDADGLAAQIRTRLPDLPPKFDMLQTNLHAARTCARVARRRLGVPGSPPPAPTPVATGSVSRRFPSPACVARCTSLAALRATSSTFAGGHARAPYQHSPARGAPHALYPHHRWCCFPPGRCYL
ncbi:hypothetical protein B0H14DRAFT_3664936 [Mycena olivaceomarginata]|nr:hypothetical protein B0H14DRAFT_3664936 [Mycena olivaceomarginata]